MQAIKWCLLPSENFKIFAFYFDYVLAILNISDKICPFPPSCLMTLILDNFCSYCHILVLSSKLYICPFLSLVSLQTLHFYREVNLGVGHLYSLPLTLADSAPGFRFKWLRVVWNKFERILGLLSMAHITYLSGKFRIYQNSPVKGLPLCQALPLTVYINIQNEKVRNGVNHKVQWFYLFNTNWNSPVLKRVFKV